MAKKSGVGKIAEDAAGYSGDLLEPIAMLVGGASKASVAWAAFRNVWMTKVLGPVGMLSGAAAGATAGILKLNKALSELGMRGAANIENLTQQFKPLLKGIESAKQRIADLSKFAASTPFRLNEVAEANRTLESLTKGALSTEQGMKLVGDAAAVTGESFADMATQVGRLYDGLQSGRPVGMVAQRLQELGILSGAARNQIESLQEQGKAGNEVWRVAEQEIKRASGAMQAMSQTLDGLQSNLDDNKTAFQTAFSSSYLEGSKAGVKAMGDAYARLTPLAKWAGEQMAAVSEAWARFKAGVVSDVAVPVLEKIGKFLAAGAVIAPLSVLFVTVGKITKSIMGLGAAAASSSAASGGFKTMGSALLEVFGATRAMIGGDKEGAKAKMEMAKALAVAGGQSVKGAGAMGALGGAAGAAGRGIKFLAGELLKATAAALLNPWVLLAAAIMAGVSMWNNYAAAQKAARAEIQRIGDVMRENAAAMEAERNNIKSLTDATAHYAKATNKLTEAQIQLLAAKRELANDPNNKNKQDKVKAAEENAASARKTQDAARDIKPRDLELGPNDDQIGDKMARAKAAREAAYQTALAAATPEQKLKLMEQHAAETKARAAQQDQYDQSSRGDQMFGSQLSSDKAATQARLEAMKRTLADQRANMPSQMTLSPGGDGGYESVANPAFAAASQFVAELEANVADAEKTLAELESKTPRTVEGEYGKLEELIAAVDGYNTAVQAASEAQTKFNDALKAQQDAKTPEESKRAFDAATVARSSLIEANARRDALEKSATELTGGDLSPRMLQDAKGKLEYLKQEGKGARNDVAPETEAIKAQKQAIKDANAQARLAGEKAAIDPAKGLKSKLAEIELAKKAVALDRTKTGPEKEAATKQLDADKARAIDEARRATASAKLDAQEKELENAGDTLETELKRLDIAKQRNALEKDPEKRADTAKQLEAEEKVVRQQFARRQAAADLDSKDAKNSGKYRGAERALMENATDRDRILTDKDSPERQARLDKNAADKAELTRGSDRAAKRAMLETNVADSANRESKLEFEGHKDAAMRERKRRQKDERELKKMQVEDDTESIADPQKRQRVQKEQMDAFDEAAKQDVSASQKRKELVQKAQDAYERYMQMEIERIKLYMRLSASQSRTAADQSDWMLSNAKKLEDIGIMVDEDKEFTKKQRQEEAAAQKDDKIKLAELFENYVKEGWDPSAAKKMAQDEIDAGKAQRATDQKQERMDYLLQKLDQVKGQPDDGKASAVSSMRSIAGGGGAYGPMRSGDKQEEIANLVRQIKELLAEPTPFLQEQEGAKALGDGRLDALSLTTR